MTVTVVFVSVGVVGSLGAVGTVGCSGVVGSLGVVGCSGVVGSLGVVGCSGVVGSGSAVHELVLQPESFKIINNVDRPTAKMGRSEEHTSELQSLG